MGFREDRRHFCVYIFIYYIFLCYIFLKLINLLSLWNIYLLQLLVAQRVRDFSSQNRFVPKPFRPKPFRPKGRFVPIHFNTKKRFKSCHIQISTYI